MKKTVIIIAAAIVSVFIFSSCEEKIELDVPDQTPKIVVQGILSPGENIIIDLRRSYTIKDRMNDQYMTNQKIVNPNFKLFKGSQFIGNLNICLESDLLYSLDYKNFQAGEKYTLIGDANGFPSIHAEAIIPEKPIVSISDFSYTVENINQVKFNLNVNIKDEANQDNYYQISLFARNPYSFNYGFEGNDENSDPSVYMINGIYFINDKLFNGKTKTIYVHDNYFSQIIATQAIDTFWVDCNAITKDYYDYMITSNKQSGNDYDIFAEPTLIKHNISGGYGILGACNPVKIPMEIHSKK